MENDFMKLRSAVKEAVSLYDKVKEKAKFPDDGKSATIHELAKPFLTGFFTIAIAGKMSAGKSTFINSLIGENLLPTGHFQTTCAITWIVSSDKRQMEVTYADGQTKTFKSNFAEELRRVVAVPDRFDSLPINDINNLIRGNNDIKTILQKKAGIEKKTGTSSEDKLWREYVNVTPKSKIADKVVINLQLPKEYEGWRIVDTPGVGAIGGIQEATLSLFTSKEEGNTQNLIDAVILLHKGSENIQDKSANDFAEDVCKSVGDLVKERLFFVLTHASSTEFTINQEGILSRAQNLFGNRLSIHKDRITYVDSLIQRFVCDAKRSKRDFSNITSLNLPLHEWSSEDWNAVKVPISMEYMNLMQSDKEVSNSTLFDKLEDIAHFNVLSEKLGEFLNDEKKDTFDRLMELIEEDLNVNKILFSKEFEAVSNGPEGINKRIKEVELENIQLETALSKLKQKATPGSIKKIFSFIEPEMEELSTKKSIPEVRAAYLQIRNKGLEAEKNYFKALIVEFERYAKGFQNQNLTFKSLDLDEIERKAQSMATRQVIDYSRSEQKLVKKGGFSSSDKYEKYYPHTKDQVDFTQKFRGFVAMVKKEGREHCRAYQEGSIAKANCFFELAKTSIEEKKQSAIVRLDKLRDNKQQVLEGLRLQINDIQEVQKYLNQYKGDD